MDFDKVESNWKTYESLVGRLSDDSLNRLMNDVGERLILCPASPREEQYGCHPGGLVQHALRVTDAMRKINSALGYELQTASILKVGLLHEIGKVGDNETDYFIDQDSDWHREKLGQLYKYNENIEKMTVSHRTLWLLQHYGVALTRDEWEAITVAQGSHLEENKFYSNTKSKLTKLLQAAKSLIINED
jgi:hypothetical protein